MRTATKPQANIDGQPALLSQMPAATTETTGDHSPRSRQMNILTSTNAQTARKSARSVPECRPKRNVPNCRHLGTFLLCRQLGTALADSIVEYLRDYFTAPAPRRLRLRRPGHRPWHSPRASCRCEHHPPHTPARHPRRRPPCEPRDASPRQPSPAADDQRWQQVRSPHRTHRTPAP